MLHEFKRWVRFPHNPQLSRVRGSAQARIAFEGGFESHPPLPDCPCPPVVSLRASSLAAWHGRGINGVPPRPLPPRSVNVLPGYEGDPRTVDKLVDGVRRTCDAAHMWLAPFSEGRAHFVGLDLGTCVALLPLSYPHTVQTAHRVQGSVTPGILRNFEPKNPHTLQIKAFSTDKHNNDLR